MPILFYILFILSSLHSMKLYSAPINEIQEINLSKAELAILDKNYGLAYKLITKNLSRKHFHFNSYIFLADFYIDKGLWSKALRVYYYLVKKLHTRQIFKYKYTSDLPPYIHRLPAPTKKILDIYFKIGNLYFSLYSSGAFGRKYSRSLLHHANRFFHLCKYYRFNLPAVYYYIGLIESKEENYSHAIKTFLKTKELIPNTKGSDSKKLIESVNQSLADALIRQGHLDAGSLFLQNIYLKSSSSSSLKEYARNYIDYLKTDYLILTLSGSLNNNSNINSLNKSELQSFDKETYSSKEATSILKNFNLYYTTKIAKHFTANFSFDYLQEDMRDDNLSTNDYKNLNFLLEVKYDNLIKSLVKLSYLHNQFYVRPSVNSDLQVYAVARTITPEYIHALKSGIISYRLPLTWSDYKFLNNEKRFDYGVKLTYIPYVKYKYFAPTYSIRGDVLNETTGFPDSKKLTFSISNHFLIKQNLSAFSSIDQITNLNPDPTLNYVSIDLSLSFAYAFKYIRGLSSSFNYSYSIKQIEDDKTNIQKYSLGLTYSF